MRVDEHLEYYVSLGFAIIPAYPRSKRPAVAWKKYQREKPSYDELMEWQSKFWSRGYNIGAVLGSVSDNIFCLDIDNTNVMQRMRMDKLLEETMVVKTGKGYHIYFRSKTPVRTYRFPKIGVEIRSEGAFVVLPNCYSEDTRVLTRDGFKYFYELSYEDEIATLNPETWEIEYHKPIRIVSSYYEGVMVHLKSKSIDLLVTPNHNVYYTTSRGSRFRFAKAIELVNKGYIIIPRKARWKGKDIEYYEIPLPEQHNLERVKKYFEALKLKEKGVKLKEICSKLNINFNTLSGWLYNGYKPDPYRRRGKSPLKIISKVPANIWMKFLGWFISEGSLVVVKRNNVIRDWLVTISQSNKENVKEIVSILRKIGFSPQVTPRKMGSKVNYLIRIHSRQLAEYLTRFGKHSKERHIPVEIKNLSSNLLEILLNTLIKGDGTVVNEKRKIYYTASKKLAEDVAEIALKCGYTVCLRIDERETVPPSRRKYRTKLYVVDIRKSSGLSKAKAKTVNYKGMVYCVEVPNHIILVERNGKICWCGNSIHPSGARYTLLSKPSELPVIENPVRELTEILGEKPVIVPGNAGGELGEKQEETFTIKNGKARIRLRKLTPCFKWLVKTAVIPEGWRNEALIRFASVLRMNGFSFEKALEKALEWNYEHCVPPLDEKEVERTVRSLYRHGYRYGCRSMLPICNEEMKMKCPLYKRKVREVKRFLEGVSGVSGEEGVSERIRSFLLGEVPWLRLE